MKIIYKRVCWTCNDYICICRGCDTCRGRCLEWRLSNNWCCERCFSCSGNRRASGEFCPRCEKKVDPAWLSKDRRINRFDESAWPAGEEVAVRVEVRIHVGIQLPAWRETQGPLPRDEHT